MSTNNVRFDSSAKQAARFIAVVVLPTPPFWFAIAIILLTNFYYKSIGYNVIDDSVTIIINNHGLEEVFSVSRETETIKQH
jgi:ABC-type dipeptide/oligopeptide/nickel transport system permease component